MMKRTFDVLFSTMGLLVLSPFFLLTAILIRSTSAGPVFFRQERVGRNGRLFRIHKFRTMRVENGGPQLTVGADPRITRTGRFLRRLKLDELPQLIDVLRGDMSLVGPRPEVPKYVALYPAAVRERVLAVRPGITDPASIRFRDENDLLGRAVDPEREYVEVILPIKLRYYEEYVQTRSFLRDLGIIAQTFRAVFL